MKLLPAEWYPQAFVQLTWPHRNTDWADFYEETITCFRSIVSAIISYQNLVIVCQDIEAVKADFKGLDNSKISFVHADNNDTWARDHGAITVLENGKPVLCDFGFNGWGSKYSYEKDNAISKQLSSGLCLDSIYQDCNDFILEGGSIDSNGEGIILTTESCLLTDTRNKGFSKYDIEQELINRLGAKQVLWLKHGYLAGDDTDGHIDMLARFVTPNHIVYVECNDSNDEHYSELQKMKQELQAFKTLDGKPFELTPLPMVPAQYYEDERLPASYANFLIINDAVLVPTYNATTDEEALAIFKILFPSKTILGIDCSVLIRQHGALHCLTMQYPVELLKS